MANGILKTRSIWALGLVILAVLVGTVAAGRFSPMLLDDTYVDAGKAAESFGTERVLWATSEKGTPVRVAYLTFSGMTTLPNQIDSAGLDIYVRSVEHPGEVSIHLLDRPVMSYMTWEDREEYDEESLATLNIEGTGWQTFDAAALVKKAAMECSEGCPFTVVLVAEGDASIGFASVDSGEDKARLEYRTLE